MITKIVKRDGREVPFNIEKIASAVFKAASAVGGSDYQTAFEVSEKAVDLIENSWHQSIPTVEMIQDAVEKVLIEDGHAKTAKEFILYRADRTRVREMNTKLMKVYEEITFVEAKDNDIKRENANIDGDTAMGTMLKYGSEGAKQFYEMYVLKPEHTAAHKSGEFHIHDLDFLTLTTTCCQIDLMGLFKDGFSTGHGYLREPNDIKSYSALACIAIQSNQNDQHGGQSVPNFDYAMAPGVAKTYKRNYRNNLIKALNLLASEVHIEWNKKVQTQFNQFLANDICPQLENSDEYIHAEREWLMTLGLAMPVIDKVQAFALKEAYSETNRDTFQAMEAFIHNLNTMHSRAGAQIPFSSINYGTDTSAEGQLVMKNLLLATEAGLGNGETPIFPIQIFKVKEGLNYNQGEPNYELFQLACKVSAKRLFPNFSFIDAPFNKKYYVPGRPETEIAYMGCRTRVISNVHDPLNETIYGRGNLSFTTINLPRIALECDHNEAKFFEILDERIEQVVEQLLERFEIQAGKKVKNFPFLMGQNIWMGSDQLGWEDEIREAIKHGTLTTGFVGLAECLKALMGVHHGESLEAQEKGLKIIEHMRKRMDEAGERYKLNFSLIATPAESTAGRFVKIDREKYGTLPGITDKEYYTNSFHVPVYHPVSAFKKIQLEAPYHALTNAGHITYVELDGNPQHNLEAFESIVRAMKEAGVGYGSINHPVDRDPICGYTGLIGEVCPSCGRSEDEIPFERIRRITGYLVGTLDRFNNAKQAEVRDRVKHI